MFSQRVGGLSDKFHAPRRYLCDANLLAVAGRGCRKCGIWWWDIPPIIWKAQSAKRSWCSGKERKQLKRNKPFVEASQHFAAVRHAAGQRPCGGSQFAREFKPHWCELSAPTSDLQSQHSKLDVVAFKIIYFFFSRGLPTQLAGFSHDAIRIYIYIWVSILYVYIYISLYIYRYN